MKNYKKGIGRKTRCLFALFTTNSSSSFLLILSRQPITADKLINVAVTGGVFYLVTAWTAG
nr:MAG TPA: hypothetical protein [Caudoviricetes sp.]